jgi:outer membrane protein OmpA-like peptidoglycan-associated protein/ABC-type nitrate/sulfonate/bicarbonate transport system substrate-binding protein
MSSHVKIATGLFVVGAIALSSYWLWNEKKVENAFFQTSDAAGAKDKIRIAVDSWVGYYPLCSALLKRRLREVGYSLECVDDGANYPGRIQALERGEYDFVVATVDSYMATGAAARFPGVVVAVIDESKGGDALIARKDKLASLDDLKRGNPKIALTPDSPSDYLAKSLSVHFDIPTLAKGKPWRKEVAGSGDALKALRNGDVEAAVLWEPDVSRALSDSNFHRLIGTEKTQRLIVDVLLAQRERSIDQPEKMKTFLQQYFRVLKVYRDDAATFEAELVAFTDLSPTEVSAMVKGVKWASLVDNAEIWLAHTAEVSSQEALINSIESVITVLKEYGDIDANPLPEHDAYRLVNSSFVHELYRQSNSGVFNNTTKSAQFKDEYPALTDAQWAALREVGTLKMRPISFASGSDMLTIGDKEQLDEIAENLSHYPNFRVEVRGHSGIRGDEEENRLLSQSRAESVTRYLELTHSIPTARLRAIGFGGSKPLPRQNNEPDRAYHYRLPRVELVLLGAEL